MDQNKINSAQEFLNLCKKVSMKTGLNSDMVYDLLETFELKENDIQSNEKFHSLDYYEEWYKSLGNKRNLYVYDWGNYWVGFDNGKVNNGENFIKIYLSLDREHLKEGVRQLISYLESENIYHTSKSTAHVRTDNVIIRIAPEDYKSLKKIYDYIESNEYIKSGINRVNPFLPTIGNIGVMYEDGRSYNSDLSKLISEYINIYNTNNNIDFSDFVNFVKIRKKNDPIFLETFSSAFFEKNRYQTIIEDSKNIVESNVDFEESHNAYNNPLEFFKLAIIETFTKYGKKQAVEAIIQALNGNYTYFPRKGYDSQGREVELRKYLQENVSKNIIISAIMENASLDQVVDIKQLIINLVDEVIYNSKGKILENALYATALKHNDTIESISKRITMYAEEGNPLCFSSFNDSVSEDYNFRQSVVDNVLPQRVYEVLDSILYNKGINYSMRLDQKINICSQIIKNRTSQKNIN